MSDEMKSKIGEIMSIAPWTSLDLTCDKKKKHGNKRN